MPRIDDDGGMASEHDTGLLRGLLALVGVGATYGVTTLADARGWLCGT